MQQMNRIRNLRLARGYSLQDLAEKIGTSKSQIDKLEKGERRLTLDWMRRLADGLTCTITDIIIAGESAQTAGHMKAANIQSMPRDLPLVGGVKGGIHGFFFDNGKVSDFVGRPANLLGISSAFAVYAIGDSMEPRFFAGELLYVNPNRPLSKGCFAVVELTDGQGLVKQFLRQDDKTITLYQFNPAKELTLKKPTIKNVFRVVGSSEQF